MILCIRENRKAIWKAAINLILEYQFGFTKRKNNGNKENMMKTRLHGQWAFSTAELKGLQCAHREIMVVAITQHRGDAPASETFTHITMPGFESQLPFQF